MTENIRHYVSDIDQVACEFTESIAESIKTKKKSPDFLQDLSKVFLESTTIYISHLLLYIYKPFNFSTVLGLVTFDARLGSLDKNLTPDSCPMKLIQAATDTNDQILRTDNGLQLWRKWATPAYKKVCRSQEYIERYAIYLIRSDAILKHLDLFIKKRVATEFVYGKKADSSLQRKIQNDDHRTLLEVYLTSKDLDTKDVVTMVSDMLLAGIDTVGI